MYIHVRSHGDVSCAPFHNVVSLAMQLLVDACDCCTILLLVCFDYLCCDSSPLCFFFLADWVKTTTALTTILDRFFLERRPRSSFSWPSSTTRSTPVLTSTWETTTSEPGGRRRGGKGFACLDGKLAPCGCCFQPFPNFILLWLALDRTFYAWHYRFVGVVYVWRVHTCTMCDQWTQL